MVLGSTPLQIGNNLFFADTGMALSNTATQEETLLTPRNQEMVVGKNLQLPPNHLFGDNSELGVGVSPHTRWLATIKEQNAQLVTGRGSPTDYSTTKSGEETRQTTVVPTTTVSWEETSGSKGKQEMVLAKTKQLKPEAKLVTGRQRGRAP